MDAVAGDPLCVWMALCHDLGKIGTDPALLPHHYGHELRGAEPAEHVAKRLALPARYGAAGVLSSQLHMKAGIYEMLRAGTRCDLLMQVHNAELDGPFWKLAEADSGRSLRPVVNDDQFPSASTDSQRDGFGEASAFMSSRPTRSAGMRPSKPSPATARICATASG